MYISHRALTRRSKKNDDEERQMLITSLIRYCSTISPALMTLMMLTFRPLHSIIVSKNLANSLGCARRIVLMISESTSSAPTTRYLLSPSRLVLYSYFRSVALFISGIISIALMIIVFVQLSSQYLISNN